MLSPAEHYRRADELMSDDVLKRDPTLPISRAKVAQAAVHAALAQCYQPIFIESRETTGDRL